MSKVVHIAPASDIPRMLRELADRIESEGLEPESYTAIMDGEIYCFGPMHPDQASTRVLWDLEVARHMLLNAALGIS